MAAVKWGLVQFCECEVKRGAGRVRFGLVAAWCSEVGWWRGADRYRFSSLLRGIVKFSIAVVMHGTVL